MKPGIYQMTDEEYFAVEAASNSGLSTMLRSPAHWVTEQAAEKEETQLMTDGKSYHCAILEPELFMEKHAVLPEDAPKRPTKAQINAKKPTDEAVFRMNWWQTWDEASGNKIDVTKEKAAEFLEVGCMVRQHPELSIFFDNGVSERAVFANDPVTGMLCKCKPDYMSKLKEFKIVLEFKSTEDARKEAFRRIAHRFQYYKAAAFYQDVMEWSIGRPDLYLFVVFERDPPYGIKVYEVPPADLARGQRQYREALDLLAHCKETDTWPAYDTTIETLEYPTWDKE